VKEGPIWGEMHCYSGDEKRSSHVTLGGGAEGGRIRFERGTEGEQRNSIAYETELLKK
jgi:hypothetical protein